MPSLQKLFKGWYQGAISITFNSLGTSTSSPPNRHLVVSWAAHISHWTGFVSGDMNFTSNCFIHGTAGSGSCQRGGDVGEVIRFNPSL